MDNTITPAAQQAYKIKWAYSALIVIIAWFALVLQFDISIASFHANGLTTGGAIVQLLSFFTILTTLLVVLSLTVLLLKPASAWGRFFSKGPALTAIAVYITVVAVVYNVALRPIWHPEGWFKLADELLHTVNPTLFIIYWIAFVPKNELKWKQALTWLWFPIIYLVYTLLRGYLTSSYPYPFINAVKLGYPQVMLNSLVLLLVFLGSGLLFIWIGGLLGKNEKYNITH